MADLEKTIKIILSGVDKDLGRTFSTAVGNFNTFKGSVTDVTQPLADLSFALAKTEAAILATGAAMLAVSIQQAGKFSDSFNEIYSISGATGDNVDKFRQDILDYGRDSKKSLEDISGAIYDAVSSGVDYKNSIEIVSQAEQLSVAGKADLNSTLRLLISSLNAYGETTDKAGKYSDILFQTVKDGVVTVPELAQSLAQVTNIAAAAGVSFEEVGSGIVALTRTGAPAAEAIVYLKGVINDILKPSSQAATTAKELGIEFNASALQSKGLAGVLDDVARATGGNTEKMALLFGDVRSLNGALTLCGLGADVFKTSLDNMAMAAGSTESAYSKMSQNFELINQNLINNMRVTLIEAGTPLLDEYKGIAEGIGNIFKSIGENLDSDSFKPVYEMLENFGTDTIEYLNKIAVAMPEALEGVDFTGLIESFGRLGQTAKNLFESIFGHLDLTDADDLQKAIQEVIDGITFLTNVTSSIGEKLKPFADGIGLILRNTTEANSESGKFVENLLSWGTAINTGVKALDALGPAINVLAGSIMISSTTNLLSMAKGFEVFGLSVSGLVGALAGLIGAGALGWKIGEWINSFQVTKDVAQGFAELTDKIFNWTGNQDKSALSTEELNKKLKDLHENLAKLKDKASDVINLPPVEISIAPESNILTKLKEIGYNINAIPSEMLVRISAAANITEAETILTELVADKTINVNAEINQNAKDQLSYFVEQDGKMVEMFVDVDTSAVPAKTDEVKKDLETLKMEAKIKGEFEIEQMKQNAETMRESLKFKADVDIAEIKAATEIVLSLSEGITESFKSTGDVLQAIFSNIGDLKDAGFWTRDIKEMIDKEYEIRKDALEMQKALNDAYIENMRARTDALNRGDALITINGDGLKPYLEAFMWEILEAIQVRVNEEGLNMLLGA
jgi:TP901 family phage tail tape measure protein